MSFLFSNCFEIKALPEISKWKINCDIKITSMFAGCKSLKTLPNLENWFFT